MWVFEMAVRKAVTKVDKRVEKTAVSKAACSAVKKAACWDSM
jgi:hypothetical protein